MDFLQFPDYGPTEAIWSVLVAALIGFLIGLERERKREMQGSIFAGIRTFPLISVFGAAVGLITPVTSPLIMFGGFLAVTVMAGLSYWRESSGAKIGGTTGFTVLVAFTLGILSSINLIGAALAGAVVVTGLLSMREELRGLSSTVSRQDLFAIVQFAAVSLIVLPLVPSEQFGPWGVWNPRSIWLQVVLISGISFVGYIAMKTVGARRGAILSGVLGGLASSTAVMLAFSRRSRDNPQMAGTFAMAALAGSGTAMIRMVVILAIVQPALVTPMLPPLAALFVIALTGAFLAGFRTRTPSDEGMNVSNPFELRTAFQFAMVYTVILLMTRAAQEYLGDLGLYLASMLGGIVRPDAVVLSLANQADGAVALSVIVRAMTVALATNQLFKAVVGLTFGSRRFGVPVLLTLLVAAGTAITLVWLFVPVQAPVPSLPAG